jgi:hypothetical protein
MRRPGVGDHADARRRGQDHHQHRPRAGARAARRVGVPRAARAVARPGFGMKGGATGGGQSAARAERAHQPALHRRLPRHHHGAQPARRDARQPRLLRATRCASTRAAPVAARIDMNDRALRNAIVTGLGGRDAGRPARDRLRHHGGLRGDGDRCASPTTDDLRARLDRILVGVHLRRRARHRGDSARRARCWRCCATRCGRTSCRPRRVPALVHGGPFANIAHGCNSVSPRAWRHAPRRLGDHRGGLRLRPRRREVLRHQVPQRGARHRTPSCWWRRCAR